MGWEGQQGKVWEGKEGQQYLLLALDQGEGDALPLLRVVIPGQLLDGLCHVCNRTPGFPVRLQAAERLKCASFLWALCVQLGLLSPGEGKSFSWESLPVRNRFPSPIPYISSYPSVHGKLLAVPHFLALCRGHCQFQLLLCCWIQVYPHEIN